MIIEVYPSVDQPRSTESSRKRLLSGLAAGGFGLVVVFLGGWWFTAAVGILVHLGLLEFFRMAQFKGMRPATKTTLVACQLLLFSTQWASLVNKNVKFNAFNLPSDIETLSYIYSEMSQGASWEDITEEFNGKQNSIL